MRSFDSKFAKQLAMALLTVVIFGAGALVSNVRAQTAKSFEIQIPFDFVARDQTYEAGTYRVGRFNAGDPDTLILKSANGKSSLILLTQRHDGGSAIKNSSLTFSRHGGMYILDTIRASGESYERRIPSSKSMVQSGDPAQLTEIVSVTRK